MWYKQTYYEKKNGKWKEQPSKDMKINMPYGRWVRSCELDKKTNDKTYLVVDNTKGGLNKKVVKATTYFGEGNKKVVYDLITTSNKKPNK